MDKFTWAMIGILIVSIISMALYFKGPLTGNIVKDTSSVEGKLVDVGLAGNKYKDIMLNLNEPVILQNDGSLRGCSSSIVQKELGIRADLSRGNYQFTPTKQGTFTLTCSMGMYSGIIKVI